MAVAAPSLRQRTAVLLLAGALALTQPGVATARPDAPPGRDRVRREAWSRRPVVLGYQLPVDGTVTVTFDAPAGPFGAGHRGIDIEAPRGAGVGAVAAGTVDFAGPVAGERWVTVRHADGRRSTVGPLASVSVSTGEPVQAGQVLGAASGRAHDHEAGGLHVGIRAADGTYLDPLALLAGKPWVPALTGRGRSWLAAFAPTPGGYEWDGHHAWWRPVPGSPVAAGPGWALPPNVNHVIGVAGLGSRTGDAPIDLTRLGYDARDVTYLSYAGRRDRRGADDDPWRDQLTAGPTDTFIGVHEAAMRLREQLREQQRREPYRAVDLVGHSLGGLVVTYYLMALHDPADPDLPPIGHVATFAAPLQSADAAAAVATANASPLSRLLVEGVDGLVAGVDDDAPVIADLAPQSLLLRELGYRWERARARPAFGPLATGTRLFTFGAQWDALVPDHRSGLPGAPHAVLPGGHSDVRRTEAGLVVLRALLAGEPVPAQAGGIGHVLSYGTSAGEQLAGQLLRDGSDAAIIAGAAAAAGPTVGGTAILATKTSIVSNIIDAVRTLGSGVDTARRARAWRGRKAQIDAAERCRVTGRCQPPGATDPPR